MWELPTIHIRYLNAVLFLIPLLATVCMTGVMLQGTACSVNSGTPVFVFNISFRPGASHQELTIGTMKARKHINGDSRDNKLGARDQDQRETILM